MHVTALRRTAVETAARTGRRPAASGASFQVPQSSTPSASASAGTAGLAHIGSLIALQSVEDADARKKRAVGQGRDLLDVLDDMKLALLSGTPMASSLVHLERTLAQAEAAETYDGDPCLKNVLDQILLRARVELAKLRKSAA